MSKQDDTEFILYLDSLKRQGVQITPKIIELWNKRKVEPARDKQPQVLIKRQGFNDHVVTVVDV